MLGFLLQWPTLVTLVMLPILVTMYVKLARREEREVLSQFGETYRRYMDSTPAFFPAARRNVFAVIGTRYDSLSPCSCPCNGEGGRDE
jgi:hypothetical protein